MTRFYLGESTDDIIFPLPLGLLVARTIIVLCTIPVRTVLLIVVGMGYYCMVPGTYAHNTYRVLFEVEVQYGMYVLYYCTCTYVVIGSLP